MVRAWREGCDGELAAAVNEARRAARGAGSAAKLRCGCGGCGEASHVVGVHLVELILLGLALLSKLGDGCEALLHQLHLLQRGDASAAAAHAAARRLRRPQPRRGITRMRPLEAATPSARLHHALGAQGGCVRFLRAGGSVSLWRGRLPGV